MTPPEQISGLWHSFAEHHNILADSVPLFTLTADNEVCTARYGADKRRVLQRSAAMEAVLIQLSDRLSPTSSSYLPSAEGILYMMLWHQDGKPTPLYIGRTHKVGKTGAFSANVRNLRSNSGKFARWGYNYAYHMGDLSAVVCAGHPTGKQTNKYRRWADRLFDGGSASSLCLKQPVYFWATLWTPDSLSIWKSFTPCSLAFQEYLLIGVCSALYPDTLLNTEGVS